MKAIRLKQPPVIGFGNGCVQQFTDDFIAAGFRSAMVITAPEIAPLLGAITKALKTAQIDLHIYEGIDREPDSDMFKEALQKAEQHNFESIIGIGGGSALDVAKIVAALRNSEQTVDTVYGINLLKARTTHLVCLPTTAGTGSEVSPNALLIDSQDHMKKGIISPHLIPDAAYIDPLLTISVPPQITAATGMDALTHCIEAYVNKFAHPLVDLYALEGVRLAACNLETAVRDGKNEAARAAMARASLYGGLCLGPVNTAAVHALAYPLGTEFNIAHGLSNAVLLPYVSEFNVSAAPERYADIAQALGISPNRSGPEQTAFEGISALKKLAQACGLPGRLSEIGISAGSIPGLARQALKVERLLKNNPKTLSLADIETIYRQAG
jgi:alcohol dehydrogenase class IV